MQSFFTKLFDTSDFSARWKCGNWSPLEGWLHIVSDAIIFLAYIAIPIALMIFIRRRRDFEFPRIIWLFFAFILSCGIAHGFEAAIFWWPAYRWTGMLKAITAVVSVATVIGLVRVMPIALSISSLTRMNRELVEKLTTSEGASVSLATERQILERRSAELLLRERRIRDASVAARAAAVCWDIDSGKILWEIGYLPLLRATDLAGFSDTLTWDNFIGSESASALQMRANDAWSKDLVMHVRFALRDYENVWDMRMTVTREAPVTGQPRTMIGLFGLVPYEQSRRMEQTYAS